MMFDSFKAKAKKLKELTLVVYFAARDPRTPILVRIIALLIAAYALSPIDLIPDFIPIIGYLDDIILIPLGLALVVELTPDKVIEDSKIRAEQAATKPISYTAAVIVILIWLVLLWLSLRLVFSLFNP